MVVDWSYFDKFEEVEDMYLPEEGQGETKATQILTCICKLVYRYYNDGDIYDNRYYLEAWANDLSSFANWLDNNTTSKASSILAKIKTITSESEYTEILKDLSDTLLDEGYLKDMNKIAAVDDIYNCYGQYKFISYDVYEEE